MVSKALLAATVISAATAQLPAIAKRDFIENRQLDGLDVDPTCASALTAVSTLYSSLPTPPADLLSVTLPADPCVTPSFTGKLQSEWSAYTSEALVWYSSHSDELLNFVTACSGLVGDSVETGLPVCSSDLTGPATTTGSSSSPAITDATSSGAGSSTGASSSGSPSSTGSTPNAAPRETGFVLAAAVAAAGFMGAVAAL